MKPMASSQDGIARCSTDRLRVVPSPTVASSPSSTSSPKSPNSSSAISSSSSSSSAISSMLSTRSGRSTRSGGRGRAWSRRGLSRSRGSADRPSDCGESDRRPRPRPRRRRGLPRWRSDESPSSAVVVDPSPFSNSSRCSAIVFASECGSAKPLPASRDSSRSSAGSVASGRISSSTSLAVCSAGEPKILCHKLTAAGLGGSSRGGAGGAGRSGRCSTRACSLTGFTSGSAAISASTSRGGRRFSRWSR